MAVLLHLEPSSLEDEQWIDRCARRMVAGGSDIGLEQAIAVARELATDLGCRAGSPESIADRMTWGLRAKHLFGAADADQLSTRLQSRTAALKKLFGTRPNVAS